MAEPSSGRDLQFADETEREIFAVAKLGEDVRAFLTQHPVGRYLHHRAKMEIEHCRTEALEVDVAAWPFFRGRNKLQAIRQRAAVARAFIDWCADAIVNGDQAGSELEDYRKG
jgi:hypothetical protein